MKIYVKNEKLPGVGQRGFPMLAYSPQNPHSRPEKKSRITDLHLSFTQVKIQFHLLL